MAAASSTGLLLKTAGLKVTSVKIDPYMNIDAGTMAPTEHGASPRPFGARKGASSTPGRQRAETEGLTRMFPAMSRTKARFTFSTTAARSTLTLGALTNRSAVVWLARRGLGLTEASGPAAATTSATST
jgi:hypothetical protein